MALVVRMKNVSRMLLFLGSLIVWYVVLAVLNDSVRATTNDYLVLMAAGLAGVLQTWLLAALLHT